MYKCGWNGCEKAYGTLNHLNAHVTMQSHGQKRVPEGKSNHCAIATRCPLPVPHYFRMPPPGGARLPCPQRRWWCSMLRPILCMTLVILRISD